METALDKYTGQIIDASQLWIIDQTEGVDKTRYVCRGCGVLANPCSYRPHNEVRPYFKADPHHLEHCDIPLESLLIKRGRKRRLTSLRDSLNKSREPARHGTECRTRRHLLSIAGLLTANGNAVMRPLRGCDGREDLFRGSLEGFQAASLIVLS